MTIANYYSQSSDFLFPLTSSTLIIFQKNCTAFTCGQIRQPSINIIRHVDPSLVGFVANMQWISQITSGATPADFLIGSIAAEVFWSTYLVANIVK